MSGYDDDRRHRSHRERRSRRDPMSDYSDPSFADPRDALPGRTIREQALVRRTRDDSPIEEVRRDFPPRGAYIDPRGPYPPRARSLDRDRRDRDHYGGGGRRRGGRNDRRRSRYDSSSSSESDYRPRQGGRRKSLGEQALAALGIGGAAGAAASKGRSRQRSRSRRGGRRGSSSSSYSSRSRSRGGGGGFGNEKIQQAVQAALTAGAVEAFRSRGEPGPWTGEKGKRILTAAVGAAGVDGLVDRDPDKKSKRHLAEAVIGGLATNRVVNGAREGDDSRSRSRGGRSRSRGRGGDSGGGGGALGGLAGAGLAAAAGKALLDKARSKSRNRGRRYSSSDSSRSRSRRPKRSKSVSDYVKKGLVFAGLTEGDKRRDDYDRGGRSRGGGGGYRDSQVARPRGVAGGEAKGYDSSDTELSSTEEEKQKRKIKGKEYLSAGFATIATLNAVREVQQTMEKRDQRHQAVMDGKLSPEQASKMKKKAWIKDAAAIGIAGLGIKGAMEEWKEVKESREQCHQFLSQREQREKHREELRKKRQARQANDNYGGGGGGGGGGGNYSNGPRYNDGNPYAGY